jgi:hypothetical protein
MNRRHFIQSGSLALAAVAGLPHAVKSMPPSPSFDRTAYRTTPDPYKKGQWLYEMLIDHNGFQDFARAPDTDKVIILKAAYCETTDFYNPTSKAEFKYKIKSAEKETSDGQNWIINTKFDNKISGDLKLPKDFPKNPKLRCLPYGNIDILGKEGNAWLTLNYPAATSSSGSSNGCFLTTACVQHKGLPDNCDELDTLRLLRDRHMLSTAEGRTLVKTYIAHAPQLVQTIDGYDNKKEIYTYMYEQMILPSVQLVKENRFEEAVELYSRFTSALYEKYN